MTNPSLPFLCELVREAIEKRGKFVLRARGFSMMPFIEDGEEVEIMKALPDEIRFGDVVCYVIRQTEPVCRVGTGRSEFPAMRIHRVLYKTQKYFYVKGDTLLFVEKIPREAILGRVSAIRRSRCRVSLSPSIMTRASLFFYVMFSFPFLYVYALLYRLKQNIMPETTRKIKPFTHTLTSFIFLAPRIFMKTFLRSAPPL